MENKEEWREVEGYDTYYVSNEGRVCSIKLLKITDGKGYKTVTIGSKKNRKTCMVRHLIAKAFDGLKLEGFDAYTGEKTSEQHSKKLTREQVEEIRNSHHLSCREAGRKFGVSYQMISLIRTKKCW